MPRLVLDLQTRIAPNELPTSPTPVPINLTPPVRYASPVEALEARQLLTAAPSAQFLMTYVRGAGTERTFAVLYEGVRAMDAATLGRDDLMVTGPGGFSSRAAFVGVVPYARSTGVVAQYRVRGLAGSTFAVAVVGGEVADADGFAVRAGEIGGFRIGARGRTYPRGAGAPAPRIVGVETVYGTAAVPAAIDTSFGRVVRAVNFGGGAADVAGSTGATVHFDSGLLPQGTTTTAVLAGAPITVRVDSSGGALASTALGADPVYHTEVYTAGWVDESVTIGGLDPAKVYRVQILHGDTRLGAVPYGGTTQTYFIDSNQQSATSVLHFNTGPGDASADTIVVVVGTANMAIVMPAAALRGPSFSGLVISTESDLPRARVAANSVSGSGSGRTFSVDYDQRSGIAASTVGDRNVFVTGPGGFEAQAVLVGVSGKKHGQSLRATYRFDGVSAAGRYVFHVGGADAVTDANGRDVPAAVIGGVKILAQGRNWPFWA